MRRYFIALLLCLLPCFVFADVDTFDGQTGIDTFDGETGIGSVAGQTVASGGEAGCYTGATFSYNGDHTSGDTYACDSEGNAIAGTVQDATVSADYVTYSTVNDYIKWSIDEGSTATDEIDESIGTIYVDVYVVDDGDIGVNVFLEVAGDSENFISLMTAGSDLYYTRRDGNNNTDEAYAITKGALSPDTWYKVGYSWDTANSKHAVNVDGGTWDEDSETMDAFTTTISKISIGEEVSQMSHQDTVRVRNLIVLDGYQETDPR